MAFLISLGVQSYLPFYDNKKEEINLFVKKVSKKGVYNYYG